MKLLLLTLFAAELDILTKHDGLLYHAQNSGMKSLSFELRVSNLAEYLKKTEVLGNIGDLYFKFYWTDSGNTRVMVEGMSQGLSNVKEDLSNLVKDKFEYIFPTSLAKMAEGYTLKSKTDKKITTIYLTDEAYKKDIANMEMTFNNDKLVTLKTVSPTEVHTSNYEYVTSEGNLMLKKVALKSIALGVETTKETTLTYLKQNSIFFPKEIEEKVSNGKNTLTNTFTFSNYKIDLGKKE